MKRLILLLIKLATFTNVSYASFPYNNYFWWLRVKSIKLCNALSSLVQLKNI